MDDSDPRWWNDDIRIPKAQASLELVSKDPSTGGQGIFDPWANEDSQVGSCLLTTGITSLSKDVCVSWSGRTVDDSRILDGGHLLTCLTDFLLRWNYHVHWSTESGEEWQI